jgi:hypothetical protein
MMDVVAGDRGEPALPPARVHLYHLGGSWSDLRTWLGSTDLDKPLSYVRDAIDKYWSEGKFELTLNVGCASARRMD